MARSFLTKCAGIVCPCRGAETVTAVEGVDERTGRATLTLGVCEPLREQGWQGDSSVVKWVRGYLVETSFYDEPWRIRSGHASKASAVAEMRQCGPKWRKEGHAVRVVAHY